MKLIKIGVVETSAKGIEVLILLDLEGNQERIINTPAGEKRLTSQRIQLRLIGRSFGSNQEKPTFSMDSVCTQISTTCGRGIIRRRLLNPKKEEVEKGVYKIVTFIPKGAIEEFGFTNWRVIPSPEKIKKDD